MEGEIKAIRLKGLSILVLSLFLATSFPALSPGQEPSPRRQQDETAQIELRKTLQTRQYQGRSVEGEERVIGPGDSLWRILVQERGLSERRFDRYLLLIGSLNPHLQRLDLLRVGDTIFIPVRPDEILGIEIPSVRGDPRVYRVKQGDELYKILREQFGIQEKKEIHDAFNQVKELNPDKKNWDLIVVGEEILFPGMTKAPSVPVEEASKPVAEAVRPAYGPKLPLQENLHLLGQVMGALGNETHRAGEEVLPFQEGSIRIDRDYFPIIHNPKLARKVVLDLEGKIPLSLRAELEAKTAGMVIVPVKKDASLHEVANSLFPHLGFETLPANQPVVIQDRGVELQVKGDWMVTTPEESGRRQEVWIISLTDVSEKTPDYLRDYLSFKGMNLKEILPPPSPASLVSLSLGDKGRAGENQIEAWPYDKTALVDALLRSCQIPFSSDREISPSLGEGIRLNIKVDRFFESGSKKFGLLFGVLDGGLMKGLEEKGEFTLIELDLNSLTSRDIISRLLGAMEEPALYREHRFPANESGAGDKLVLTVSGFFLPQRSLLLTDREIPKDLQRFFAEKGLRVVYFH